MGKGGGRRSFVMTPRDPPLRSAPPVVGGRTSAPHQCRQQGGAARSGQGRKIGATRPPRSSGTSGAGVMSWMSTPENVACHPAASRSGPRRQGPPRRKESGAGYAVRVAADRPAGPSGEADPASASSALHMVRCRLGCRFWGGFSSWAQYLIESRTMTRNHHGKQLKH